MTGDQNKDFMRRFLQASVDSDPAAFSELLAADFTAHLHEGPQDRDAYLKHNGYFNRVFSDRNISVEDLIAEGDKVAARITWSGVQRGEFRGLSPTGQLMKFNAILIERIRDGKSVEHWSLFDPLS